MKNNKTLFGALIAFGMTFSLVGCGNNNDETPKLDFDFVVGLSSGRTDVVYLPEAGGDGYGDKIVVYPSNEDGQERTYTYSIGSGGEQYLEVFADGTLDPIKSSGETYVQVTVTEETSGITRDLFLLVKDFPTRVDGGYNWASNQEARNEILGQLERYAMENYLTGISLFENGGYVRYASRVHLPTNEYITGYGFGLLSDGYIDGTLPKGSLTYPTYLHSATSSDPLTINAWNATGSQVSDLNSYITTSYWGTELDGLTAYKWYPILAKDTVNGQPFNRPIHLDADNELEMYKNWRIYVKTGEEGEEGIKYRTGSDEAYFKKFDNRPVELEDYEFVYQLLLTERSDLIRGGELAGDTAYGIKGALSFYNRTKDNYDIEFIDNTWKNMQTSGELGIKTGKDSVGSYIDLELINPIDSFTAMYSLSSNLYSPIPREFIEALDPNQSSPSYIEGVQNYGNNVEEFSPVDSARTSKGIKISDTVLSVGPYFLDDWVTNSYQVFTRNDDWYECKQPDKYRIDGIYTRVYTAMTQQQDFAYNLFLNGELDSTSIPQKRMEERLPTDLKTKGSSTFKLNVNSCTQERWNELFGNEGSVISGSGRDNKYLVKPWMSNKNFLNGLFWSINRKSFADARGVSPSINYLADAYMADPQKGLSYNSTDAHLDAIAPFHNSEKEDYGYNVDKAITYFQMAVNELVNDGIIVRGTKSNPTKISIDIEWMYASDTRDYGEEIGGYFTKAFNDNRVSNGTVQLVVNQDAVTQWDKVYSDYLQVGEYDLGFGAISGNTYDPLNFFEVLKSDNSSLFTLNWGEDTGKVNPVNPIVYQGKSWSFDALWSAADHGAIVDEGVNQSPIKKCYTDVPRTYDGTSVTNDLYNGFQIDIPFEFINLADRPEGEIELLISKVSIYLFGCDPIVFDFSKRQFVDGTDGSITYDANGKPIKITLIVNPEKALEANNNLVTNNKIQERVKDLTDRDEIFRLLHPFVKSNYNVYWNIDVYYTLTINGGFPTENLFTAKEDSETPINKMLAFARL